MIGGLGDWFKKRLDDSQGIYHQVNPFDGGRTFDTNRRQVMPTVQPSNVRHRNVFQKSFDQVNLFDNGRSWGQSQANTNNSVGDVLRPFGKAVVKAPAQFLNTAATQIPQLYYTGAGQVASWTNNQEALNNAIKMQNITNDMFDQNKGGLFNAGTFYGSDDAKRGDLKTGVTKVGGGTLQTAATVVPFARGGNVVLNSGKLLPQLPKLAAEGAIYGAGYSSGSQLQNEGRIDPKTLLKDTATGAAAGVIIPSAGRGVKIVAQKGYQGANNVIQNATPLNQIGAIGRNVTGKADDTAKMIAKDKKLIAAADRAIKQSDDLMNQLEGGPGVKVAKRGVKIVSGNADGAVPDQPLTVTNAQPNQKLSRFANKTIQNSDEVSSDLQKLVKDQKVTYTPVTNKARLAQADKFLKGKSNNKAYVEVVKRFDDIANVDDQDVVNAIQAAKRMDASGKEDDLLRATEIYDTLSRHLTRKGQEIQAASLLNNRTPQGLFYQAQKNLKKGGVEITPEVTKNLKKLVDTVKKQKPGTYEDGLARFKVMEYVEKLAPSSAANKGVQLWKAGLLSAPTTTGGNLAANTAEQTYKKLYQDPIATGFDHLMSVFTGKRSKSMTFRGLGEGFDEGLKKGVRYFKTGYDPRNPLQKFDIQAIHFSDKPLGKAAEKYTQSIFKLMGGQDQPYYYAALRNSLADQAVTAAKNAGLKGAKRQAFIKKFITEPAKDALQLADDEARYSVFQNKTALGNLASKVNKGPVGQYLIPFSQVPSSIATRMIERTPIGLAKEIVTQISKGKFNQRAMSKALADSTAGIAIMGAGAALAKSGNLTLSYPTDQKERDLWELEGKQPNSVKIGNTWVSLNYFQPMGTLFAAGANYQAARDKGEDQGAAFSSALAGASKAFTEQSFLKGVSGALQAVSDPQRSAERFAENTTGSLVPNFIRSGARSLDDVNRMQDGLGESVIAGIPGLRETLPERTNIFGEPVARKTDAINSYFNPLRPSNIPESTPISEELRRLFNEDEGITASKIIKSALGEDIELNRDQQLELRNQIGQQLKEAWSNTIQDGRYAQLTDADKRRTLERVKEDIVAVTKQNYGAQTGLKAPDPSQLSTRQTLLAANQGGGMIDYLAGAGDQTIRDNFANSSERFQVIGDNIYYKAANGDIVVKPKALYDYEQKDATLALALDRARGAENLEAWMNAAQQKIQNLEAKKAFYDPVFEADEIARITLQQENLMEQAEKYASYGGFKKGGRGGGNGVNLPSINVGISSDLYSPVVAKTAYRAPSVKLRNTGSVRVGTKRSGGKVKINAPKKLA